MCLPNSWSSFALWTSDHELGKGKVMRLSPVLRFLSSNGFYVHIKNKTPNWQPLLSEGEKIIGYPSSLQSLVNLKYLFNEEVSTLVGYLRKLMGTQHPLLKLASNMLESPPKAAHARSVLLLLISKAAGIPTRKYSEETIKHGIHEHQRQLAELIEMSTVANTMVDCLSGTFSSMF